MEAEIYASRVQRDVALRRSRIEAEVSAESALRRSRIEAEIEAIHRRRLGLY